MEQATFFSLFFLTFMATAMAMAMAGSPPSSSTTTTTTTQKHTNFVKTSCKATTYPSVCLTSLLPYATAVKSNPIRLAKQALSATLKSASATRSTVTKLAKRKNISKGDAAILRGCIAEIKDAMDEITESLKAISSIGSSANIKRYRYAMPNVQTWANTAAITDDHKQFTCVDELSEVKGSPAVKKKIKSGFVKVARQSSNALYLINHLDN